MKHGVVTLWQLSLLSNKRQADVINQKFLISHLYVTHRNYATIKLSRHRETVRFYASLNILPSHSRSLKVIRNDNLKYSVCKSLLLFHCNFVSCTILRYSVSNNGMTLKSGLGVVQGHWEWHQSICATYYWCTIVSIAPNCTIFKLFDIEQYCDLQICVRCHSNSFAASLEL